MKKGLVKAACCHNRYALGGSVMLSACLFLTMVTPGVCGLFGKQSQPQGTEAEEGTPVTVDEQLLAKGPLAPGDYHRALNVGGRERFYEIHVPSSCVKGHPAPVVLNLHGGSGTPKAQRKETGMDGVADANGFIVVYPAGTSMLKTKFLTWNIGIGDTYAVKNKVDDMGYLREVLRDMGTLVTVDPKRIYATGISQGAFMCYRMACEMSDKIAAIAPVSGVLPLPPAECHPARPVPIMHFHGLLDNYVAYHGGIGAKAVDQIPRASVDDTLNFWAANNKVQPNAAKAATQGDAQIKQWGADGDKGQIVLYTFTDGGHTWPGGRGILAERLVGRTSHDVNASQVMWDFFKQHALP